MSTIIIMIAALNFSDQQQFSFTKDSVSLSNVDNPEKTNDEQDWFPIDEEEIDFHSQNAFKFNKFTQEKL